MEVLRWYVFLGLLVVLISGEKSLYDFHVTDIGGNPLDLNKFKGRISLVVNVASQCGHTESHYKALKRLHDILSFNDKFTVLAFPSNDFGEQEPWEQKEIEEFVRGHFKAEFPLMSKVKVTGGDEQSPLWKFIVETSGVSPTWNFHKYLVSRKGKVVKSWDADTSVESIFDEIQAWVNNPKKEEEFDKLSGEDKSNKQEL